MTDDLNELYEEWYTRIVGCPNCGEEEWTEVELDFGPLRGEVVEICAECEYPYNHEESTYGNE